jgi:hypothetical protein
MASINVPRMHGWSKPYASLPDAHGPSPRTDSDRTPYSDWGLVPIREGKETMQYGRRCSGEA